ncbi:MAG: asparagine synthase-related protein [Polyangiaceae bacterium]
MGALFGFSGPPDPRLLARMGEALAHRGRGDVVTHVTAHGSLAVRSVRPKDAPRLRAASLSVDGELAVAFSGLSTSRVFSEPSQLLAAYRERGPELLHDLRGAYVLAVLDADRMLLARDGAGVRTLYYGQAGGRFLFAVEPKGVLAHPEFPRRIRPAALAQYLSMSFVPGGGTMLEGLYELCPGHHLSRDAASPEPKIERWFVFEDDRETEALSEEEWVERFRREHAEAVARRLPDGPVAVFLSGGLDSSAVTAEVARQHEHPVLTYAIHFGQGYDNELSFAREVAERAGTRHREVLLRPKEFLPRLRRILWHLDDPIGDPITAPNFELAALVARDVDFAFNGEGGDPVFGGPKNIPMLLHHWYGGIDRDERFRARMYLASYRRSYEEWPRVLAPLWRSKVDAERDLEAVFAPGFDAELPTSFLNKLCAINIRQKGAHLILPKVDRMAGASGLTTLSPLFDERLIESSFRMPPTLKLKNGIEKLVMKRAYADLLPESVVRRPKSGMRVPVHFWFQGEMKRYAKKVLSKKELARAGIFDPKRVAQILGYDTDEGPGRYGLRLWMLLSFEIWRRIVVEREPV